MMFVPWYPLSDVALHAPETAGVFQVRLASGLINYPRGKSAMVHYGWGPNVRAAALDYAGRHPQAGGDWLCRHLSDEDTPHRLGSEASVEAEFAKLLAAFVNRFGQPPHPPAADAAPR